MARYVYKAVWQDANLDSFVSWSCAINLHYRCYSLGSKTEPVPGTGLLCFPTLRSADAFVVADTRFSSHRSAVILRCTAGRRVSLGEFGFMNQTVGDLQATWKRPWTAGLWPKHTIAVAWLKPVAVAKDYSLETRGE